jgi:ABC-type branched-subunit amino acid transport system ATPase component/ABC-type branched-subunit amino acid transport system permease subunit
MPPAAVGLAAGALAIAGLHGSWRIALVMSFIFGIISLSIVVVTGYAGQVSLAQLTLAGAAAFLLSPVTMDWGIPFPIAPIIVALAATVLGVVVGLPALRIRGLPVAVVTLSLAVALQALWFRNSQFVGSAGKDVSAPTLFGANLGPGSGAAYPRWQFCVVVLVVFAAAALSVAKLRTTALGNAMLAVRANERSAAASGINVLRTKLAAFAIAAFIAGLGGSMLGYKLGTVTFDSFDVLLGLGVFATVYLAGITSVSGGVLAGVLGFGGLAYYASTQWFGFDAYWYQIVTGVGLVLSVVLNPEGIVGPVHEAIARLRARRAATAGTAPAAQPARRLAVVERADEPAGAMLGVRDMSVRYGGIVAVDRVDFDVPAGAIVGLIGPNGAGKTTLIDAVSGFCSYQGSVTLAGRPLDKLAPHRRIRAGLGRTFQGIELWNELTVAENVTVGGSARHRSAKAADQTLALLGISNLREHHAGELSQGQRQLVSIARSLLGQPRVLLLDEPAAGLDSTESEWLAERLRDIRDAGTTILLVDHDMNLVLTLCDHIEVLDCGRHIASGSPDAVRGDSAVTDAYLGSRHGATEASAR